jgi:ABC-type nitrate/sulfonate/bicarbonate transport system substrate-binding protein
MRPKISLPQLLIAALLTLLGIPGAAWATEAVKVALVSRTVFNMPAWVAERKGFLKQEGIDPTLQIAANTEELSGQLRAGGYHFAISPPESVMVDAYKPGSTVRIIGGNARKLPHFIITKPEIKTLAQLRGTNIGVFSMEEGTTFLLPEIARKGGFAAGDYKITPVGGAPTRWRLLKEGKIDVGLQPFPLSYEAEAAGFNNLGPVLEIIQDWQFTTINVNEPWAKQNPKVAAGFLRALRKGHAYMEAHPEEAAEIAAQELRTDIKLAARALNDTQRFGILDPQIDLSEPGLARVFQSLQQAGLIDRGRTFNLSDFTDLSYLQESKK